MEIFPPHHTTDGRLLHLGSPLRPPSDYQVQVSLALPPGRSSLRGLILQEIIVVLFYVLRFLFI